MDRESWKILRDYALSEPPEAPPQAPSPYSAARSWRRDGEHSSAVARSPNYHPFITGKFWGEVGARNQSQMQPYYQQGQGTNPFSALGQKTLEMLGIVKEFIDPGNFEGTRTSGSNFAANPTPTNALNAALNPVQDVAMVAAMGPAKAAARFMEKGVAPIIKGLSPLMAVSAMEPGEAEAAVGPTKWYSALKRSIQGAPMEQAPKDQWLTKKVIPGEEIFPHSLLSPKQGGGFRFRTEVPYKNIPERTEFGGYLGSQKGLSQEQLDELEKILSGEDMPPVLDKDTLVNKGFRNVKGKPIDPDKMLSEDLYRNDLGPGGGYFPTQYADAAYRTPGPVLEYQETVADSPMAVEIDDPKHFAESPDQIYHTRTSQRQGPEGGTYRLLEEIQSDRHQRGRTSGYYDAEHLRKLQDVEKAYSEETFRVSNIVDPSERAVGQGRLRELEEERRRLYDLIDSGGVPDAPFKKDWVNLGVRRAVWEAASAGDEGVLMTPPGEQSRRWSGEEGLQSFYDTQVARALRQEAKRLGLPEDAVTEMPIGKEERFTDKLLGGNNLTTTLMARQNLGELAGIESEDQLDEFIFDNLSDLTDSFTTLSNRFMNHRASMAGEVASALFDTRDVTKIPESALPDLDTFTKAATDIARLDQRVSSLRILFNSVTDPQERAKIADRLDSLEEEFMDSGHVLDAAISLWKLSKMPEANRAGPKALGFKLSPELRQKILDEGMPFKRGGLAQVRKYMAGGSVNFGPLTTPYG
jgi:hypothetical protein